MFDRLYIANRVTIEGNCWNWTQSCSPRGYGQVSKSAPETLAHRLSWVIYRGPIPPGMNVCHTCDNPSCVNPDHLFIGTQHDNMSDMVEKGRHYNDTKSAVESRMIPPDIITNVLTDIKRGIKKAIIARFYGISVDSIRRIELRNKET